MEQKNTTGPFHQPPMQDLLAILHLNERNRKAVFAAWRSTKTSTCSRSKEWAFERYRESSKSVEIQYDITCDLRYCLKKHFGHHGGACWINSSRTSCNDGSKVAETVSRYTMSFRLEATRAQPLYGEFFSRNCEKNTEKLDQQKQFFSMKPLGR